ncbi:Chaperone protein DnaJ [Porphyridium purpureum]|uniref:Chaperone protein DnaJ n=1 Tax=Porphyridium purpureum TaxID=35688 RepID=A0A5J4YJK8_PORPP|nr:Chaperone protein DnaJ [Porphyridium purpureum]|eukprot:POR4952..scf246_12
MQPPCGSEIRPLMRWLWRLRSRRYSRIVGDNGGAAFRSRAGLNARLGTEWEARKVQTRTCTNGNKCAAVFGQIWSRNWACGSTRLWTHPLRATETSTAHRATRAWTQVGWRLAEWPQRRAFSFAASEKLSVDDVQTDFYTELDLPFGASDAEIKKQYRMLALKYHPDRRPQGQASKEHTEIEEKFKRITRAYTVLSDPDTKKAYDRLRMYIGEDSNAHNRAKKSSFWSDAMGDDAGELGESLRHMMKTDEGRRLLNNLCIEYFGPAIDLDMVVDEIDRRVKKERAERAKRKKMGAQGSEGAESDEEDNAGTWSGVMKNQQRHFEEFFLGDFVFTSEDQSTGNKERIRVFMQPDGRRLVRREILYMRNQRVVRSETKDEYIVDADPREGLDNFQVRMTSLPRLILVVVGQVFALVITVIIAVIVRVVSLPFRFIWSLIRR